MKKVFITTTTFLLFTFYFLLFAISANAQSLSLAISPPLLEVMIQPGKSITQVYKLSNPGEIDLAMTSKVLPFSPQGERGEIAINNQPSAINNQFLSWFSFQNANLALGDKFLLKAGGEQEVVLKLRVPENAPEDDYYATLLFETLPSPFSGESGAQAQAKIGTNLLLTVSRDGRPPRKVEIIEFKVLKIIDSFDRPHFLLRLKNTGRSFLKPMGIITITGWFEQKYILELLPENILVNSLRQIQCQSEDNPQPCRINSKFLLGRYQVKAEFGLDQLSEDYLAETTFFALPIKLILGLVIIAAIFWIVRFKLVIDKSLF